MRAGKSCAGWVLALLAVGGIARAQAPAPAPAAPGLGRPVLEDPGPVGGTPTPLTYTPPPEPAPIPVAVPDPGPNGWAPYEPPSTPPGFFFDIETVLLFPTLRDSITNTNGASPAPIRVPAVSLDLTVSPTIEIGYRLPDSAGYFAASYRFLASQGTGTSDIDGSPYNVKTRLDIETFNLDYGSATMEVYPRTFLSWRLGARIQNLYFDSTATQTALLQSSNNFFGAGIHGRLDVVRPVEAVRGLSLFGRLDGAVLVGRITQTFRDQTLASDPATATTTSYHHTQSPPQLLLQAGVSYVPPIFTNVTLTTGYQFEGYWYLGQFNTPEGPSAAHGSLYTNGWFLRAQVDF